MKKIVLILLSIVLIALISVSLYLFVPMEKPGQEVVIVIEPGAAVSQIASKLKEKRVIPHAKAFLLWLKFKKLEKSIQAGKVSFYENEGIVTATKKLLSAKAIEKSITINEGLTIEQTARKIKETFPIDTAKFIQLCYDPSFITTLGLSVKSLEGYLFPNTYRFNPEVTAEEVVKRLVNQFQKIYIAIPQTDISQKFSQLEIITLASIVEREATLAEERTRIAGVFHNRLRLRIPLGADPTVRFFLKKFSGPLRVSELRNPSPYNTRVHVGLPPGPICSPGKKAIEAAIKPIKTKDLFFVAKWDGSGEHDFSETGAAHERKKHEIRRRNKKRLRKQKKDKK